MSRPLIELIVELFREYVDDPAPVATAEYIDASVNYEELDYEPYRFRLHFIPLPDSLLVTSVERHPTQKEAPVMAAMFSKFNRLMPFSVCEPAHAHVLYQEFNPGYELPGGISSRMFQHTGMHDGRCIDVRKLIAKHPKYTKDLLWMFTRPLDSFAPNPVQADAMSVALFRSDVNEINLMALDEKNELPVFWAYMDTADPTSFIVKVPMHCYYGDRGSLAKPRMSYHPHMARNAPSMLRKMDSLGVTGFEYHVRFRPEPGQPAKPPVIRLMRPGLDPKTGNVMSTGAHCTPLLQPATWNAGLGSGKAYSVNLVLPWLIDNLTDPQAGHGPAVVAAPTLAVYNEEQATITQDVWVPQIHPEFASAHGGR